MKKYRLLVFVLIAAALAFGNTEWEWTNVGKTWNVRPILCPEANDTSMSFIPYTSDSDTAAGWTIRTARREIDSLFITGHCDNAIKAELWCVGYGDSSWWQIHWYYGNHRSKLLHEVVFDTALAPLETCHVLIDCLHRLDRRVDSLYDLQTTTYYLFYLGRSNYAKWGSLSLWDSSGASADSVKFMLIEFDQ
jgi:hypothetical protein